MRQVSLDDEQDHQRSNRVSRRVQAIFVSVCLAVLFGRSATLTSAQAPAWMELSGKPLAQVERPQCPEHFGEESTIAKRSSRTEQQPSSRRPRVGQHGAVRPALYVVKTCWTRRLKFVPKDRLAKPDWIRVRAPPTTRFYEIKQILREHKLHTVCEEASCPNIGECFGKGTATFMIMGDKCTRRCPFCDVASRRRRAGLAGVEEEDLGYHGVSLSVRWSSFTLRCVREKLSG